MIRRLHITLRASEALVALTTLHAPPADHAAPPGSSAATAFGARFGLDVGRAFDACVRGLDVLGQCLDWLERRSLCEVERPRTRGGTRSPTWQAPAELRVDVRALARDVTTEADDADSKARASAWALRTVLRHLAGTRLHVAEIRSGSERVPALEALAAYDAVMATAGFGAQAAPPARLAHLASRARRKDEAPAQQPLPTPTAPTSTRSAATTRAPSPAPARKPEPKAPRTPMPTATTAKRAAAKARPKPATGFGGLPDDAMPEDRRIGDTYGPRGLTTDAEFFLAEAGIATWPCEPSALERGRRAVVSKLHPDRAGEASTTAFHRAIKGHAELAKKLSTPTATATAPTPSTVTRETPSNAATASASAGAATTHTRAREAETAVSGTATSTTAATSSEPPRVRRPRARAVRSQTEPSTVTTPQPSPPTPPASPTLGTSRVDTARATTFEWPPRPAEPSPPAIAEAPAPAPKVPSVRRARSA